MSASMMNKQQLLSVFGILLSVFSGDSTRNEESMVHGLLMMKRSDDRRNCMRGSRPNPYNEEYTIDFAIKEDYFANSSQQEQVIDTTTKNTEQEAAREVCKSLQQRFQLNGQNFSSDVWEQLAQLRAFSLPDQSSIEKHPLFIKSKFSVREVEEFIRVARQTDPRSCLTEVIPGGKYVWVAGKIHKIRQEEKKIRAGPVFGAKKDAIPDRTYDDRDFKLDTRRPGQEKYYYDTTYGYRWQRVNDVMKFVSSS